ARSLTDHAPPTGPSEHIRPTPEAGPRLWPRVVGVLILLLGVAAAWIWQDPASVRNVWHAVFPGSVSSGSEIEALRQRVARLEERQVPDLAPIARRLDALEGRSSAGATQPMVDLGPILARLDALEGSIRAAPSGATPDTSALTTRLDALE